MAKIDSGFSRNTDIFGDAPVRIVVCALSLNMRNQIMAAIGHPFTDQVLCQPASPVELQAPLDFKMGGGYRYIGRKNQYDQAYLRKQSAH